MISRCEVSAVSYCVEGLRSNAVASGVLMEPLRSMYPDLYPDRCSWLDAVFMLLPCRPRKIGGCMFVS